MTGSALVCLKQDGVVAIRRIVRQMAGRSQSRLVEAEDGFYVAKFLGNPQGNRTLANEWICSKIIQSLGVATPEPRLLHLSRLIQEPNPISFQIGNRILHPEGDLHFGSPCPVNPEQTAIFDFMPRKLLFKVENIEDFAKIFVIDRWLSNTDQRQAVFFRSVAGYRANFIDHGMCLGGSLWEFEDSPRYGLAAPRAVYELLDMKTLTAEAVNEIDGISEQQILAFVKQIPVAWLSPDDEQRLEAVVLQLKRRQAGLSDLVHRHLADLGFA